MSKDQLPGQEWPNDWNDDHREVVLLEARTKAFIARAFTVFFVALPSGAAVYGTWSGNMSLFEHVWLPSVVGLGWLASHYFHERRNAQSGGPPIEHF